MKHSSMLLGSLMMAFFGAGAFAPAYAGGCPQGQKEMCPDYENGVSGPCQCVTIHKIRGTPQTLVNNTGAAPPPPTEKGPTALGAKPVPAAGVPPGRKGPAMIGSAPKAPQFPGCCSTCVQPENWCYSCTDNTGGGACAAGTIAAECKMLGNAIACDKK